MKKYGIIILCFCVLVVSNVFLYRRLVSMKEDRDRIQSNYNVIKSDFEVLELNDSTKAATIKNLQLKKDELENYLKQLKEIKVKPKEITTIVKTEIVTKIDTVLVQVNDTCKEYVSEDVYVSVCNNNLGLIISTDVFVTNYERRKKKFLWFRVGRKEKWSTVSFSNKHIDVTALEAVTVSE